MNPPVAVVVVLCTAPAAASRPGKLAADDLARRLVEDGLCACVNVLPAVRSYFRWQGAVDTADELLLIVKTTAAAVPSLRQRLLELHPYDVPEILELPVAGGAPEYLRWLADAVTVGR
jgi:periplasmic divalent cation tolerance protein